MNQWNRLALQIAAVILTCVSIVFTVLLWSQLPETLFLKTAAGLAGLALELCKFSLLPLAFFFLTNRETAKGCLLLTIGSALFIVSIGASVTFLETGDQARQQQSVMWQQRQTALRQLEENIRIAQASASRDIAGNYRQRGLETLQQISQWQTERQKIIDTPIETDNHFLITGSEKRFYAWLLLALLIDGCAITAWSLLGSSTLQNEQPVLVDTKQINTDIPKEAEVEAEPEQKEENNETKLLAGKLTIRGIMESENVGYKKAKMIQNSIKEKLNKESRNKELELS